LRKVSADSRSVFDQDTSSVEDYSDIESDPPLLEKNFSADYNQRMSSPTNESSLLVSAKQIRPVPSRNRGPWDGKKHPSPNRTFLQNLEQHIGNDPNFPKHPQWPHLSIPEGTTSDSTKRVEGILVRKDINIKLSDSHSTNVREASHLERVDKGKNESSKLLDVFLVREQGIGQGPKTSAKLISMVKTSKLSRAANYFKSRDDSAKIDTKQRVEARGMGRSVPMNDLGESSMMEIDELQMDRTAVMGNYQERKFKEYC
jgi:hypothetical protein